MKFLFFIIFVIDKYDVDYDIVYIFLYNAG